MALLKIETWIEKSLQGITFWTGHRHCLYPHYPLGESAFVAEICNLIYAHLDKTKYKLECEKPIKNLIKKSGKTDLAKSNARADIVVSTHQDVPFNIIEVKRASSNFRLIKKDLKRLSEIKLSNPDCRCYLFLISERKISEHFVSENGKATLGPVKIDQDTNFHFRVRRVFKAASSFNGVETANYAICLEVFNSQ